MNRKWLFAGALASVVMLGASSRALADDYCARPDSRQNVYVDGYSSHGDAGYGYTRPYDSYDGGYSYEGNYGARYDGPRYDGYPQTQYPYSQPYYQDGYGRQGYGYGRQGYGYGRQGYGGGTVHEDHIRTSFKPFPFPHIDKRVVHHEHPVY